MEIEKEEMSDREMETISDEDIPPLEVVMEPELEVAENTNCFKVPAPVRNSEMSTSSPNSNSDLGRPKKRRINRALLRSGGMRRSDAVF